MTVNIRDLVDILELGAIVKSPATALKLVTLGKIVGLRPGSRVIDFGCGQGEALALWAQCFGITGVGIDRYQPHCERAVQRLAEHGLSDQIEIVCMNAAEYVFEEKSYDVASCIGASFIWGGFRPTICRMQDAIHAEGRLVIGEPYYTRSDVPPELIEYEGKCYTEPELFEVAQEEGFEVGYIARASADDWDRYAANWCSDIERIKAISDPTKRQEERGRLHHSQDMYIKYRRGLQGWAMYVLYPVTGR